MLPGAMLCSQAMLGHARPRSQAMQGCHASGCQAYTSLRNAKKSSGSQSCQAPDVFGVTGKVGEQRGDGVRAAMVMVPAEVAPAAGAATPAVEPPPGAAR